METEPREDSSSAAQCAKEEMQAAVEVARIVRRLGGRALLVGGCVRDALLGGEAKDIDIECFSVPPDRLAAALGERFDLDLVGASFGVLKLKHLDVDVAIPRRETKLGEGHRAFRTEPIPNLSVRDAAARRDFTVNAIYRDPLTDEIVDPWHGREDLERKVLRHVSDHFAEDPLRVLRGMQFVARFGLEPDPATVAVCRAMTPENLPPERLFGEWAKLLTKGVQISKGLAFLRATEWLKYYPELARLVGCAQDPAWHPEGDVWNHTLCCLDAFAAARTGDETEDLIVGLAVLCHDFGKPQCTAYDPVKKRIRSLGHDECGVEPTRAFLRRLTNEERLLKEVPPLVQLHMRPFAMWRDKSSDGAIRRLAAKVVRIDRLLRVAAADDAGRPPFPSEPEPLAWLAEQAKRLAVEDAAPKPLVKGRDLLATGMKPGPTVGRILATLYDAQLDGAFADAAGGLDYLRREMAAPPCIFWDWNGTLLDDTQAALDTLNEMIAARGGKPIDMPFYRDHFAFPVRPFYDQIGISAKDEDEWNAIAHEYHEVYMRQAKALNREAVAALETAKAAGCRQFIISALRQDFLDEQTESFGVKGFFERIVGSNNLDGATKTDRARVLLREMRPAAANIVLIGDALHDKEVADALGVPCILCAQGSHAAGRLRAVAPTADTLMEAIRAALFTRCLPN